MVTNK